MKLKVIALAAAWTVAAGFTAAEARPQQIGSEPSSWEHDGTYRQPSSDWSGERRTYRSRTSARRGVRTARTHERRGRYERRGSYEASSFSVGHHAVGARPRQWCGWWMRTRRGGGPELNLAWNWSRWGRPTGPQVGAVVVWRHHVGEIVGQAPNGQWIVRSGNDGGAVRTRARSVAGAVFRI